jgi:hypothetical protein
MAGIASLVAILCLKNMSMTIFGDFKKSRKKYGQITLVHRRCTQTVKYMKKFLKILKSQEKN